MKRLFLAIILLLAATLCPVADAATPSPLTPDCRYLFVVDTSLSMSRLQDQVTASLQRMITSGLDGQMSPGEVFTIWTFNEAVYQRDYPLNSWRPELNQSMGSRVRQYLQSQRFRREPNMRALLNAINQARQICPRIAIFLISNGQEVLVGTPFDRNINVNYGRRFAELRAARVPFLTTLVCQDGRFASWAVTAANEPVNIPPGPDGNLIVGRPKQIATMGPTPVMTTNRPSLAPATNEIPKSAIPVRPVATNQPTRTRTRPGVITLPGPPPTERKVVELTPKPPDPNAPRVVNPTDIAPSRKKPLPVFRKTNDVAKTAAVARPPQTNVVSTLPTNAPTTNAALVRVAKVSPPPRPRSSATMTVKSANRPAPKPTPPPATTSQSPAPQRTNTVANTSPAPATINKPEPEVVIQVVTQIVMAPLPSISPEKTTVTPPVKPPVEKPKPEPAPVAVTNTSVASATAAAPVVKSRETNASAPGVPSPAANTANETPPAPAPSAAPTPEPITVGSLLGPNLQNTTAWLFLAGGILALLIAIACFRRLMTRPGESSMISQSMERRE